MTQKRKRLSGPEKIAIVKRYLVERVPISDLCDEHGLQPSQIYRWQAAIFEHGADVFDMKKGRHSKVAESVKDARITKLEAAVAQKEAKLAQKNEVISELMEENVLAKKASGALCKDAGFPLILAMKWSITSTSGPSAPRSLPSSYSPGWDCPPASSTSGENTTADPMPTTAISLGMAGSKPGRRRQSPTFTADTHSKATGDSHS